MNKKFLNVVFIFIIFMLTACGNKELAGESYINDAKDEISSLDSGSICITNELTGELQQTFTFLYKDNGDMMYSYVGKYDDENRKDYFDGETIYVEKNGSLTVYKDGDKDYQKFTKENPHPDATGNILTYEPSLIKSAKLIETDDEIIVTNSYDVLNFSKQMESNKVVREMTNTFHFTKDGKFKYLEEYSKYADEKGILTEELYKLTVENKNQITEIINPIDVSTYK